LKINAQVVIVWIKKILPHDANLNFRTKEISSIISNEKCYNIIAQDRTPID